MRDLLQQDSDLLVASEIAPGGIIVYYADGDEEIIHVNSYVVDLFECDSFEDFMQLTGGSFRGFVEAREIEGTEDSIWGQVEDRDGLDHIYYQIRTKTGRLVSIDDYGRLVRREGERPIFVVFVIEVDAKNSLDWLTGLPSIDRFMYLAEIEAAAAHERGERLSIAAVDLMGMRVFNARHGRKEGDELIKSCSNVLSSHFGRDRCCRANGDSFFAFAVASEIDGKIAATFDDFAKVDHPDVPPLMAGSYTLIHGDDIVSAMDRTRYACYSDRITWKSHLTWYTDEMRETMLMRVHILEHLDRAIEDGWIVAYYQSVVRSSSEAICHEEALARWIDPELGPLSPAQFIPVLEEAGLLLKLDLHIVDCVLADMGERRSKGIPVVPVSINFSLRDLGSTDIADEIAQRADAAQIPHELLRIEFTESTASNDPDLLKTQIRHLHRLGFEVWMDDFGSGYSSLNSIGEFDFDVIKLDMGFIARRKSERSDFIVDGVIRVSKRMGRRTLAEGIETEGQAARLADMGCDMLQGYRYSKPRPLSEIERELDAGTSLDYEPFAEEGYWNAVGSISLPDIASNGEGRGVSETPVSAFPAGVLERRGNSWRGLRANASLREFMDSRDILSLSVPTLGMSHHIIDLDDYFCSAIRRADVSGTWERISGVLEQGSGFQFHVCPIAIHGDAHAYVITSTPTLLGSALGIYGDVPVAYAVMNVVTNEEDGSPVDIVYVYANQRYREWSGFGMADFTGMSLREIDNEVCQRWIRPCYRAAVEGKTVHEVVYSPTAGHWLSINIAPSPMPGHCLFAFTYADAEQQEREELHHAGVYDSLTGLLNRRGFDESLSERMYENGGRPFSLAMLSVDDFKTINDLYGHDVGDEALRTLAGVLLRAFPPGSLIARNSGDELVAAVFGSAAANMDATLDRLAVAELYFELHGRTYTFTLSAGYTWCDGSRKGLKAAFSRASRALHEVRLAGKPGHLRWVPAMEESPHRKLLGFTTRELAEGMPLAMLAHRPDGEILFANKGFARMLGYDSLEVALDAVGHTLRGVVHPDDWSDLDVTLAQMVVSETPDDEHNIGFRVLTAKGTTISIAYRARLVDSGDKGKVLYAYMVDTDVVG